jgi:MoaA/NifB/PqqE/SkfB family radical SAM enzyme
MRATLRSLTERAAETAPFHPVSWTGMHWKTTKTAKLMRRWWRNGVQHTPLFVRFIPTDRCNLDCTYCFQKSTDQFEMSWEDFSCRLEKADRLGTGVVSFLGGEPLLWPHISDAVAACTERNFFTDLTTNGTLLDDDRIESLGAAGLDYLNVSADVIQPGKVTKKCSILAEHRVKKMLDVQAGTGMKVRVNAVLYKDNSSDIFDLIEYTHEHDVPISIGFVVPEFEEARAQTPEIYFTADDADFLAEIAERLIKFKNRGYKIIDTRQYFRGVQKYLRGEQFWKCNYQKRFGWINITPRGKIRSCTKKMDEVDLDFLDLDHSRIKGLRRRFRNDIEACNRTCYSNCAFNSAYYARNLHVVAFKYLTGWSRNL